HDRRDWLRTIAFFGTSAGPVSLDRTAAAPSVPAETSSPRANNDRRAAGMSVGGLTSKQATAMNSPSNPVRVRLQEGVSRDGSFAPCGRRNPAGRPTSAAPDVARGLDGGSGQRGVLVRDRARPQGAVLRTAR